VVSPIGRSRAAADNPSSGSLFSNGRTLSISSTVERLKAQSAFGAPSTGFIFVPDANDDLGRSHSTTELDKLMVILNRCSSAVDYRSEATSFGGLTIFL
jgi:hypothetical protein